MTESWARQWLSYLDGALWNAFSWPRCGGCEERMNTMPNDRLCRGCNVARIANDGVRCITCDAPGVEQCHRCEREAPPFTRLRAPWLYGGVTADFIRRGKFHDDAALIDGVARSILDDPEVEALVHEADHLVPVPLARQRLVKRGFNQSAIIARVVGRRFKKPVRYALRRTRETTSQSALSLADRAANVQQAFAPRLSLSGTALLVDDVVTSGETVSQAARALHAAGIRQVMVLAVARAPDPSWTQEPHA